MNLTYYNPVRTITGAGSLRHLDALIRSLSAAGDHILVLAWDPCVYDNDVFAGLEKITLTASSGAGFSVPPTLR